jgi:hypothetical protein
VEGCKSFHLLLFDRAVFMMYLPGDRSISSKRYE